MTKYILIINYYFIIIGKLIFAAGLNTMSNKFQSFPAATFFIN